MMMPMPTFAMLLVRVNTTYNFSLRCITQENKFQRYCQRKSNSMQRKKGNTIIGVWEKVTNVNSNARWKWMIEFYNNNKWQRVRAIHDKFSKPILMNCVHSTYIFMQICWFVFVISSCRVRWTAYGVWIVNPKNGA